MKIILVFKTHFDIGFTDLSAHIIDQYAGKMLREVVETCDGTADMGDLRYVWTMPSWPLRVMQQAAPADRAALDRLIQNGQIAFHALPFTSHFDFGGVEDAIYGLGCAKELAAQYGLPLPVSAKMTDVPGHGRLLPTILAGAGVKFLHLGCNEFATPPKVPHLFRWRGPDGGEVVTMYGAGGYGSTLTPPEGWDFPVWMALMHTHDNCGPQSADMLRGMVAQARETFPDAEIVCGTMDDFYRVLSECDLSRLPVVAGDLADTWIHGAGTYPAEVRQVRRAREALVAANAAAALSKRSDADVHAHTAAAYENLMLFDEHTWGLDVKTWLPDRVYDKAAFETARKTPSYRLMERSWDEQRVRACTADEQSRAALAAACTGDALSALNPNGSAFTGWMPAPEGENICGEPRVYAENLPALSASPLPAHTPAAPLRLNGDTLENHRYLLKIDLQRGKITELFDKKLGRALLRERHGVGVFDYRYDRYGADDLTEYLRTYAYRFSDWGVRDNGRDSYPECGHTICTPHFESLSIDGATVSLHYRGTGHEALGDADRVTVSVSLPPKGDELFVRVHLDGKAETPFVESGSLALPMAEERPRWRMNKNGDLIDPATDIVDRANHALYCVEAFACAEGEQGGLCCISHDAPLCAIGETGIYAYRPRYEEHEPILYWNLFNNMWGTNFPQWLGGDFTYDFTLFGYPDTCGGAVYDRALTLTRGAFALPLAEKHSRLTLPEGVQVVQYLAQADGSRVLTLRDTALTPRTATLSAPGRALAPIDLRGTPAGEETRDALSFDLPAFGIRSFIIR